MKKEVAPRNRTLTVSDHEVAELEKRFVSLDQAVSIDQITNKTIHGDLLKIIDYLPRNFVDLMIIDPPYNIDKNFHGWKFSQTDDGRYMEYLESWLPKAIQLLKPSGSIYVCCDWKSTAAVYQVMNKYLTVRNRISWQREKGRGAKTNWKNCTEDIWYATVGADYYFDVDAVKVKRKVIAPYRENGKPKDWEETDEGNFRLTYPSNFWDDITIPFWSMPENTDHPTQKSEKLFAKLILASSPENGVVFDPFLGSGTTSVVAKKLGRRYCGVEINKEYCSWVEKRLDNVEKNQDYTIQGYSEGVFWERNSLSLQKGSKNQKKREKPLLEV